MFIQPKKKSHIVIERNLSIKNKNKNKKKKKKVSNVNGNKEIG